MSEPQRYSISEQNVAMVRRLWEETWNQGNLSVADELMAEEHVLHDPQYAGARVLKRSSNSFQCTALPSRICSLPLKICWPKETRW